WGARRGAGPRPGRAGHLRVHGFGLPFPPGRHQPRDPGPQGAGPLRPGHAAYQPVAPLHRGRRRPPAGSPGPPGAGAGRAGGAAVTGETTLVLIRYGEIGLKGRNRPAFERRLADRVRLALKPVGGRVWREHGRLFAEAPVGWAEMQRRLEGVFGIVSFSPVRRVPLDLDAVIAAARDELRGALSDRPPGPATFRVAARRANKRFPYQSMDINRRVGAALLADPPPGRGLAVED